MGILGKIKGMIFRKKEIDTSPLSDIEREPLTPDLTPRHDPLSRREPLSPRPFTPEPLPGSRFGTELAETKQAEMSNLKAKIDLLLTEINSVKIQNQTISERLRSIEKQLAEMRGIRYY